MNGKVILICGKIGSGKSTYAETLRRRSKAVVLSVDEITLSLFGQHCGDRHDEYVEKTKAYLFQKSLELTENNIDVILDWGFWTRQEREAARKFYGSHRIACAFHYIDIHEKTWHLRLKRRNEAVLAGKTLAYFVDENLAAKFAAVFEMPHRDEMDVWVTEDSAEEGQDIGQERE